MTFPQRLLDGYAKFRTGRYAEETRSLLKLGAGPAEAHRHDHCLL